MSKIDNMKRTLLAFILGALLALIVDLASAQSPSLTPTKTAVFAGGCFWCIQPAFDKANGVIKTVVGYCGGTEPNPTYDLVTSEKTNYRESIEITYDPAKISFDQLLDIYWRQIDPTQADGQFTDIGPSYRAAIFYGDNAEKKIAGASKEKLTHSGKFDKPIATEILPLKKFYPAEAYHQKYYQQNAEHFEAFEKGSGRVSFQEKTWNKSP
jgi:methionine-S-sulfoxide reductase